MIVSVGDTVLIRQDRHTDRAAHDAHGKAEAEREEAEGKRFRPLPNPAPMSSRLIPAIVFAVADDGSTIAAHVFHGARGIGFDAAVIRGDGDGEWRPRAVIEAIEMVGPAAVP